MKKYSLSISLPQERTLEQDAALDELLSVPEMICYSRKTSGGGDSSAEYFEISYTAPESSC